MAETDINFETDQAPLMTSLSLLASDTTAGLLVACSAAVDCTAANALYLDAIPYISINYPNASPTTAYVTAYYTAWDGFLWTDDGYGDAPDGTDQTITIGSPTNLKYAGIVNVTANRLSQATPLISVATAFGFVPKKFSVVIHNGSGQTLGTSTHTLHITCVTATTA